MELEMKVWLRTQMLGYLRKIKAELNVAAGISGQLVGTAETFSGLPTTNEDGSALDNLDWALLTTEDGANQPGVYITDGSAWAFAMAITNFTGTVGDILASATEAAAGTSSTKAMTVAQVTATFAMLAGDDTQTFAVGAAEIGSNDAVRASQFSTVAITDAEVLTDWDDA